VYFTYCLGWPKNSGEAAATERMAKRIATLNNYNKNTLIYENLFFMSYYKLFIIIDYNICCIHVFFLKIKIL